MSSLLSESIVGDWLSDPTFASQHSAFQSTQTSVDSQTTLDAARPDLVHASLGNSWSSYLSAQHQSREVAILRRATNENFKQIDLSVVSLQRDLASHDALVKACVADFRTRSDQITTQVAELKPLQESIPSLQQDLAQHKEHSSKATSDMNHRLMAMQQTLDGMDATSSKDLQTVQGQYRSALEKIEFLQGELREMREEKMSTEAKLAALERKVTANIHPRQELSVNKLAFLDLIQSRHDDLMKLLDRPAVVGDNLSIEVSEPPTVPRAPTVKPPDQESQIPLQEIEQYTVIDQPEPTAGTGAGAGTNKRKRQEPEPEQRPIQWKKIAQSRGPNLKALFYQYKREFENNPPKSEVAFIWKFIDSIDTPEVSRHIQESLANLLPGLVSKKRETRQIRDTTDKRHVNISTAVTWKIFQQILGKMPPLR